MCTYFVNVWQFSDYILVSVGPQTQFLNPLPARLTLPRLLHPTQSPYNLTIPSPGALHPCTSVSRFPQIPHVFPTPPLHAVGIRMVATIQCIQIFRKDKFWYPACSKMILRSYSNTYYIHVVRICINLSYLIHLLNIYKMFSPQVPTTVTPSSTENHPHQKISSSKTRGNTNSRINPTASYRPIRLTIIRTRDLRTEKRWIQHIPHTSWYAHTLLWFNCIFSTIQKYICSYTQYYWVTNLMQQITAVCINTSTLKSIIALWHSRALKRLCLFRHLGC